ncbi:hypothetical protein [Cohnella hongkongensis]|uniref:GtrA-like protein domain-containing protein n=1 Tax=Cohnella hongkongensis TaxID=178337 RepID=A0ABV9FGH1_9BACL
MRKLKQRLNRLAWGEAAASVSFLAVYGFYVNLGAASLTALLFLVFQLLQGAAYWGYRSRNAGREASAAAYGVLTLLRSANLIGAMLIVPWLVVLAQSRSDLAVGLALHVFAIVEYVNYYWYRLSYGKSGFNLRMLWRAGLRPSSIHKLLKRKPGR